MIIFYCDNSFSNYCAPKNLDDMLFEIVEQTIPKQNIQLTRILE